MSTMKLIVKISCRVRQFSRAVRYREFDKQKMQMFFNTCLTEASEELVPVSSFQIQKKAPEPIKFKLVKSLNLLEPILRLFALPHRQEKYTFSREKLYIAETELCSIPFLYQPHSSPSSSILVIYSHGSGSTLNHVHQYITALSYKFNVATIAYDYTGDGESTKRFHNYEMDIRCVLAWAVKQGYDLRRTILCGFSLGSYPTLSLKGQMPRILISPICGLTSYVEGSSNRYEGEEFDNVGNALEIRSQVLITHCSNELIPIEHGRMIEEALLAKNKKDRVEFVEITDKRYDHKSAPGYLFSSEGSKYLSKFICQVGREFKISPLDQETKKLKEELLEFSKEITVRSSYQYEQYLEKAKTK